METAKYQVFVSSTFEDLQAERRAVMEEILNTGHFPAGMELFQASNAPQWDYVKKRIATSDYFLVIVAERYGSTEGGVSFTQREYEYAIECGVPVAAFVLSDSARRTWPRDRIEQGQEENIGKFRDLVSKRLYKAWGNVGELRTAIVSTLHDLSRDFPRPGWVRSDSVKFINLVETDPSSKTASSTLIAAVDRDLSTAGYYRSQQVLDFGIEVVNAKVIVSLVFEATINPTKAYGADVYKPKVSPPKGVKLLENRYSIDGVEVGEYMTVTAAVRDRLCVKYQLASNKLELEDRHSWPSPVLDYKIRFRRSDLFDFEVGRLVGRGSPDPIASTLDGDSLVFIGKGAALTAQGVRWKLLRARPH